MAHTTLTPNAAEGNLSGTRKLWQAEIEAYVDDLDTPPENQRKEKIKQRLKCFIENDGPVNTGKLAGYLNLQKLIIWPFLLELEAEGHVKKTWNGRFNSGDRVYVWSVAGAGE